MSAICKLEDEEIESIPSSEISIYSGASISNYTLGYGLDTIKLRSNI